MPLLLSAAARTSNLSRAQLAEVLQEVKRVRPEVEFDSIWIETTGDKDQKTSLKTLDKTDFFTKEIDALLLEGKCRIGVHSAKDLPEPLPEGLFLAALTTGVDSSDALVLREGETLKEGMRIGSSSSRREDAVRALGKQVTFVDIRGSIEDRLSLLDQGIVDAVVIARAALIRLHLAHLNHIHLRGPAAPLQGQLAVVTRADDLEMHSLFARIDSRVKTLYLGTEIQHFQRSGTVIHCPLIQIEARTPQDPQMRSAYADIEQYTHVIFTSKHGVRIFLEQLKVLGYSKESLEHKKIIAIGNITAKALEASGCIVTAIAAEETQEGVIALLQKENLDDAYLFLPGSALSRPQLHHFLVQEGVRHQACAIYDTLPHKPEVLPDLEGIQEIIFTSPSTVHAFFQFFPALPSTMRLGILGPITERVLKNYLKKDMEIFYV